MVELLRHRQTKGAATDMFYLTPPRHISTLPKGGRRMRGKCRASSVSMAVSAAFAAARNPLWCYLYVFCNCGEQHVPTFNPK